MTDNSATGAGLGVTGRRVSVAIWLVIMAISIGGPGYAAATAWDWPHSILFALMSLPLTCFAMSFLALCFAGRSA